MVNVVKEQRALSGHARWAGHARGASHMKSQRWRLTAAGVHGDPYLEMAVYVGVKL